MEFEVFIIIFHCRGSRYYTLFFVLWDCLHIQLRLFFGWTRSILFVKVEDAEQNLSEAHSIKEDLFLTRLLIGGSGGPELLNTGLADSLGLGHAHHVD